MAGHALADIQSTYGCTFIGLCISILLFGITVCQTWIYFWQYAKRDSKPLKLFILVILLLDTLHTILCVYSIYWYLILNFGNLENLGYNMWSMNIQVVINTLVEFMIQLFYARRVYVLSKSIIIPTIIAMLGTVCFALGFVFTARATALRVFSRYTSLIGITCIGLGSGVVADILIAFSMCWFLYHKRTGFTRTDSMIMTLMSYSINSGMMTCIITTGVLITFSADTNTLIWEIFFWPMGKIYANSFLAMLNSRDHLRDWSSTDKSEGGYGLSSLRIAQGRSVEKASTKPTALSINVHHTKTTDFPEVKHDHDVETNSAEAR